MPLGTRMRSPLLLLLVSLGLLASGCANRGFADPSREFGPTVDADLPHHRVSIHVPEALGAVDTHVRDVRGAPVGVSCRTCHEPGERGAIADGPGSPEDFHEGFELVHGDLTCDSCHDPFDRTHLHLADGELVDFPDAIDLCTQCHGVQARDYRNGSHGGMTGYWDLRRGPRSRNHCVDCHAPHDPAYRPVIPVRPPRDRYFRTTEADADAGAQETH